MKKYKVLIAWLICLAGCFSSYGQRSSYIVDSVDLNGILIIDEIGGTLLFFQDSIIIKEIIHKRYSFFKRQARKKGKLILDPSLVECLSESRDFDNYTKKDSMPSLVIQKGIITKIHRKNGFTPYEPLYTKGGRVCYSLKIKGRFCLLAIKRGLLAKGEEADFYNSGYHLRWGILSIK